MPGRLHQGQLLLRLLLLRHLLLLLLRHLRLLLLRLLLWLWGWLHPKLRKRLRKLSPKRDRKTPIVILRRRRRGPKGSCRGELRLRLRLLLLRHLLLLLLRHLLLLLLRLLLWLWGWLHPRLRKRLRKLSRKRGRKTPIVILRRRRRGPKGSCRGELRLRLGLLLRLRLKASLHRGHGP
jgi:hypothetical protein